MPEASEFVVFEVDFSGTAAARESADISDTEVENIVQALNKKAATITKDLQTEVAQVSQPLTSGQVIVHVGVNFRSGTIVVEGLVIAVLTAMGTIASQTISQALGQNLATLLQRRFRWFFQDQARHNEIFGVNNAPKFAPFSIDVGVPRIHLPTPQPDIQQMRVPPNIQEMRVPQLGGANQPLPQIWQQTVPHPNVEETRNAQESSGANWLLPAVAVGTTITIVLLAVLLTIVIMQAP
jgi:hypothetical protein